MRNKAIVRGHLPAKKKLISSSSVAPAFESFPSYDGPSVYFILLEDKKTIKIGYSTEPRKRFFTHQQNAALYGSTKWRALATLAGSSANEGAIHEYFKKDMCTDRRSDELFNASDELKGYIRWLRNQSYVATTEDEIVGKRPFEEWCPRSDRTIAKTYDNLFSKFEDDFPPRRLTEDDYYTPLDLVDAFRRGMGGIDLDPASHPAANAVLKIPQIYTIGDDGLNRDWFGRVWLNPPFGQWDKWAPKIEREMSSGRVEQLAALFPIPAMSAQDLSACITCSTLMLISRGRWKFWGPYASTTPSGHGVMYFGDRVNEVATEIGEHGTLFRPFKKCIANC